MNKKYSDDVISNALALRFKDGLGITDISHILNIPIATLKHGLHGDLWQQMKEKWDKENPDHQSYKYQNKNAGVLTLEKLQKVAKEIDSILELAIFSKKKKSHHTNPEYTQPCRNQYGMNYVSITEAARCLGLTSRAIFYSIKTGQPVKKFVFYRSNVKENTFL